MKRDKPTPEEIERDIERTRCSIARTISRLERELSYAGSTGRAEFVHLASRAVRRVAIEAPVRKHPLLAVGAAAMLGVVASRALGARGLSSSARANRGLGGLRKGAVIGAAMLGAFLEAEVLGQRGAGRFR